MTIRWVTPVLGTAAWRETEDCAGYERLDVRDLIDGSGNSIEAIRRKIDAGVQALRSGKVLVVCCDWGASRSNAIAAGILANYGGTSIAQAFALVAHVTRERDIKVDLFNTVRLALEPSFQARELRRIAVLGGSGLLGAKWAEVADDQITFFPRASLDLHNDLTSAVARLSALEISDIVLLAQPRRPFGSGMVGDSVALAFAALELARSIGARLIVPSSIAVFGGAPDLAWLGCYHEKCPYDDFGVARSSVEHVAEVCAASKDIPVLIVRFPHLYGPGNRRPTILTNSIELINRDEPVTLRKFQNGLPELDLLAIDDAVNALNILANGNLTGVVHIGTQVGTPVASAIGELISLAGSRSRIVFQEVDGNTSRHVLREVEDELLAPRISLVEGLRRLLVGNSDSRSQPGGEPTQAQNSGK